jgi:hypothetical protein
MGQENFDSTIDKRKGSLPWKMHQHFNRMCYKYFNNPIIGQKPTGKDLQKWKLLLDKYGENNTMQLVGYCFRSFDSLRERFGWYALTVHVIYGFSDSIFGLMTNIDKYKRDRVSDEETYDKYSSFKENL